MNPPFSITINITEATQCHSAVSQLLRVFPSLSLTITANETIPASASPPQTSHDADGYAHIRAYVAACICSIYPRADPSRFRDAIDKVARSSRVDSDSRAEGTRIEAGRATDAQADTSAVPFAFRATPENSNRSYPWDPGARTEAAADTRLAVAHTDGDTALSDTAPAEAEYRLDSSDGDDA